MVNSDKYAAATALHSDDAQTSTSQTAHSNSADKGEEKWLWDRFEYENELVRRGFLAAFNEGETKLMKAIMERLTFERGRHVCKAGKECLAERMGQSVRNYPRALAGLVKRNLVEVQRTGRGNMIFLRPPEEWIFVPRAPKKPRQKKEKKTDPLASQKCQQWHIRGDSVGTSEVTAVSSIQDSCLQDSLFQGKENGGGALPVLPEPAAQIPQKKDAAAAFSASPSEKEIRDAFTAIEMSPGDFHNWLRKFGREHFIRRAAKALQNLQVLLLTGNLKKTRTGYVAYAIENDVVLLPMPVPTAKSKTPSLDEQRAEARREQEQQAIQRQAEADAVKADLDLLDSLSTAEFARCRADAIAKWKPSPNRGWETKDPRKVTPLRIAMAEAARSARMGLPPPDRPDPQPVVAVRREIVPNLFFGNCPKGVRQ